ncbi:glutathione S-transferase [Dunaliella salina]|uniref:Glutathione S-transferase n=1 Tax=Dunaliella salina TaxID=3046 RepID=A0ABQ7H2I0_DUNSA|nr:glutathione S-transferase [Dunaliella salina]|eukprot:KAF5841066.1 glutathione S-transferase [Dunaliella salina]
MGNSPSALPPLTPKPNNVKLLYFNLAAKGEPTRLMLSIGKVNFEDKRVPFEEWPQLKSSTPFGQLPVLEVDGTTIAQAGAIERYAAKLAHLYPSDPLSAAKVDQVVCFVDEFLPLFAPTMGITDPEAKANAQREATEKLKPKLAKLNEMVEKAGNGYLAGSKLTYADIAAFCYVCFLLSGMFAGATMSVLDSYPALSNYRKKIASLPEVKAYYEKQSDRDTFKP